MARSPRWKVYNGAGKYIGCTVYAEDAAVLVAVQGDGATIRDGHRKRDIAWTQGADGDAGESYGLVAVRCNNFASDRLLA